MDKRGKNVGTYMSYKGKKVVQQAQNTGSKEEAAKTDLTHKIKMGSWHPTENTFAVAKHNSLFIYTQKRSTNKESNKE